MVTSVRGLSIHIALIFGVVVMFSIIFSPGVTQKLLVSKCSFSHTYMSFRFRSSATVTGLAPARYYQITLVPLLQGVYPKKTPLTFWSQKFICSDADRLPTADLHFTEDLHFTVNSYCCLPRPHHLHVAAHLQLFAARLVFLFRGFLYSSGTGWIIVESPVRDRWWVCLSTSGCNPVLTYPRFSSWHVHTFVIFTIASFHLSLIPSKTRITPVIFGFLLARS